MGKELIPLVANIATAVGVFLVWLPLWFAKRQAVTVFEDTLAREFRKITHELPVKALLGQPLDEGEHEHVERILELLLD